MAFFPELFSPFNENVLVFFLVAFVKFFKEIELLLKNDIIFFFLIPTHQISDFGKEVVWDESE